MDTGEGAPDAGCGQVRTFGRVRRLHGAHGRPLPAAWRLRFLRLGFGGWFHVGFRFVSKRKEAFQPLIGRLVVGSVHRLSIRSMHSGERRRSVRTPLPPRTADARGMRWAGLQASSDLIDDGCRAYRPSPISISIQDAHARGEAQGSPRRDSAHVPEET